MNKDANLLAEAYQKIVNSTWKENKDKDCKFAKKGCDCDGCEECKDNQRVEEAKNNKELAKKYPPYDKVTRGDIITAAKEKKSKGKSKRNEEKELKEAYETILEYKLINKKFARRYNKLTSAMLKAEPGSEEYGKIKSEREDLVSILKDHGMSPRDLEEYLVKKEREMPLPEVQDHNPQTHNQYQDNSYTDTVDLAANTEVSVAAAMQNPSIEASAMAPDAPAKPAAEQ